MTLAEALATASLVASALLPTTISFDMLDQKQHSTCANRLSWLDRLHRDETRTREGTQRWRVECFRYRATY